MNNLNQKGNEGRKQRAAERRVTMQKLAAQGKTNKQIGELIGVKEKTVENSLAIARKDPLTVTEDNRQTALDELLELKNEVKSHRKGSKPLPLAAVDRLIKIAEVVMRLEGTAAPTKSIHATVSGPQLDVLYLEIRQELLDLSDGDKQDALLLIREFAQSRKKPVQWGIPGLLKGNSDEHFS